MTHFIVWLFYQLFWRQFNVHMTEIFQKCTMNGSRIPSDPDTLILTKHLRQTAYIRLRNFIQTNLWSTSETDFKEKKTVCTDIHCSASCGHWQCYIWNPISSECYFDVSLNIPMQQNCNNVTVQHPWHTQSWSSRKHNQTKNFYAFYNNLGIVFYANMC